MNQIPIFYNSGDLLPKADKPTVERVARRDMILYDIDSIEDLGIRVESNYYAPHKGENRKSIENYLLLKLKTLKVSKVDDKEAEQHGGRRYIFNARKILEELKPFIDSEGNIRITEVTVNENPYEEDLIEIMNNSNITEKEKVTAIGDLYKEKRKKPSNKGPYFILLSRLKEMLNTK